MLDGMDGTTMANASVTNILSQIATVEREIINPVSGSAIYAYDEIPYTISTADMPLFVNFPGQLLSNEKLATNRKYVVYKETRNFKLSLFIGSYGQGVEGEKFEELNPYFDLVYNKFGSYPHLKNMGGIQSSKLIADTGDGTLEFIGSMWFGSAFTLQVVSKVLRLLGDNE